MESLKGDLEKQREEGVGAKRDLRTKDMRIKALEGGKETGEKETEKSRVKLAAAEAKVSALSQERGALAGEKVGLDRENRVMATKVETLHPQS